MKYQEIKRKQLKNKHYVESLEKFNKDIFLRVGRMLVEARLIKGVTQEELANKLGTFQSAVARIESGNINVSLGFLQRIANALNTSLIPPKFEFMREIEEEYDNNFNYSFNATYCLNPDREEVKNQKNYIYTMPNLLNTKNVKSTAY